MYMLKPRINLFDTHSSAIDAKHIISGSRMSAKSQSASFLCPFE